MESPFKPTEINARFAMSWTAYVRPLVIFLIMLFIGMALVGINNWLGAAFIAFCLSMLVIQILTIRSVVLYTDSEGVWVYRGIFPWSRGTSGVKWRDIEDAVYFPNFLSWLLKSYTVRIGHRFTKSSEIVLPHIACGHDAVVHINDSHRNALDNVPTATLA